MKKAALLGIGLMSFAVWASAQTSGQPAQTTTPAAGQTAPATGATPGAPAAKRPPQAKTQPEFDAYKLAVANTDPAALEKATDSGIALQTDGNLIRVASLPVRASISQ